ncbi:MAG: aldehyde dehydrogenase family protein [Syntrophomonadaceae bacterium]|nr:aldehyde dehydrogenase family protein [Syntrophomonadaceae bacterium]
MAFRQSMINANNIVPVDYRIEEFPDGMNYLVDGEIRSYHGQGSEVVSPLLIHHDGNRSSFTIGKFPNLGPDEALQALAAAQQAYASGMGEWPQMSIEQRINAINQFAWHMRSMEKKYALLEMWEIAKPYTSCLDEFKRTLKYIQDSIERLRELDQESSAVSRAENYIYQVRRCPLGICLCMGPFNYPLNETFAMLIPALLMGNTLIIKPPRYGALCLVPFFEAFARSFPPGVVNIINGDGATIIGPIMESGKVTILGFTGSSRVARLLTDNYEGSHRLRTILGLEAKNPAFIFPDADLELAARECVDGALEFNGQRCTALKHIWVHEKVADHFLELFTRRIGELKCGMPWEEGVRITPLPEDRKCEWLSELILDAEQKGARVVNPGGGFVEDNLFHPAVLYPVSKDMKIHQLEQFGPLIPVSSFSGMDELVDYLVNSDYGQQASLFTASPQYAAPLIDILVNHVSRINLNAQCRRSPDELPFTGRKNSAEGTLSVSDALRSFSIRSLVVVNEQGKEVFFRTLESGRSKFLRI